MLTSDRRKVGKVGSRLGTPKPAWIGRFPNLPNVPNLQSRVRTHTRARARMRTHTHPHPHTREKRLGTLGRLGKAALALCSSLPNLLPTFPTSVEAVWIR